jgi:hypothetical protein
MLGRYTIERGRAVASLPLRQRRGLRIDTRKHTRHVLRPDAEQVQSYLEAPGDAAWKRFAASYRSLLRERFARERSEFDSLAEAARARDVFLGCNCPTRKNPDPRHCHTILALQFMRDRYPDLEIELPATLPSR